jgi:outer membrane protein assembly factor BamB
MAYRLNASDGSVRWHRLLAQQAVSTLLVLQDTRYVPASDGSIYALRTSDGQTLWHTRVSSTTGGLTGSHLLAAQDQHLLIMASSADGTLLALNAESGASAWRLQGVPLRPGSRPVVSPGPQAQVGGRFARFPLLEPASRPSSPLLACSPHHDPAPL